MRFNSLGNMGARTWWGTGTLSGRNLGAWSGNWLMGVNGPPEGKYDLKFVTWCENQGHSCIRTVDIFWAFQYHRTGFPMTLGRHVLRRTWREQRQQRREAPGRIREGFVISLNPARDLSRLKGKELHQYVELWYPDPGPWSQYYQKQKTYFLTELARYKRVLKFWRECGHSVRKTFLRCAKYSNRRPETHPDYLVVFRNSLGHMVEYGFVEVKGPRESLRPSQRKFFPELVRRAGQKIWLARFSMRGTSINFARFTSKSKFSSGVFPTHRVHAPGE